METNNQKDIFDYSHLQYIYGEKGVERLNNSGKVLLVLASGQSQLFTHQDNLRLSHAMQISLKNLNLQTFGIVGSSPGYTIPDAIPFSSIEKALEYPFDIVVLADSNYERATEVNDLCKEYRVSFIWACHLGNLMSVFRYESNESLGEINPEGFCRHDNVKVRIGHIEPIDNINVNVVCDEHHNLSNGDKIELFDQQFVCERISNVEFNGKLIDSSAKLANHLMVDWKIKNPVYVKRIHDPANNNQHLASSIWDPRLDSSQLPIHLAFMIKNDTDKFPLSLLKSKFNLSSSDLSIFNRIRGEKSINADFSFGILGSVVVIWIINILNKRFPSSSQWMHFNMASLDCNPKPKRTLLIDGAFNPLGFSILWGIVKKCKSFINKIYIKTSSIELSEKINKSFTNNVGSTVELNYLEKLYLNKSFDQIIEELSYKEDFDIEFIEIDKYYDKNIYNSLDVMITTGGGWNDRRIAGENSIQYSKPLIDVGVQHFVGHIQTVIPHLTESYNCCSNDVPECEYPYCVIKSFPNAKDHAIIWARNKLTNLLMEKPKNFNEFIKEDENFLAIKNENLPEGGITIKNLLPHFCSTWPQCVSWARNKFEKYFSFKAQYIIHTFPLDWTKLDGTLFWSYPKIAPTPIVFNPQNPLHFTFVLNMALAWANIMGIKVDDEDRQQKTLIKVLETTNVMTFVPQKKKIVTDENLDKETSHEDEQTTDDFDFHKFYKDLLQFKSTTLNPYDTSNLFQLDDLLIAIAQLRCQMYGIPLPDAPDILLNAERCCSCPWPINQVLTDLTLHELRKLCCLDLNKRDEFHNNYNWWISLSTSPLSFLNASPQKPTRLESSVYTLWDKLELYGKTEWLLSDFLDAMQNQHNLKVNVVVQGTKMVYVKAIPTHKNRLNKLMNKLIKIEDGLCKFVLLNITAAASDGDDISVPPVKYYYS